jgi:hypothetical protein
VQILTAQTSRLPKQPGMNTGTNGTAPAADDVAEVQTFGMPQPGSADESDPNKSP